MKNLSIEVWRVIFTIYIVIYHTLGHVYNIRTGGYIGVDVFFIISGYFLALKREKMFSAGGGVKECGFNYLLGRIKRLYPMFIIAYIIDAVLNTVLHLKSLEKGIEHIYRSFPEMFMIRITVSVNGVSWFVPAMLISGVLLYILLYLDKYLILESSILPLFALFVYGSFNQTIGRIHATTSQVVFPIFYDGIWRAIAGMSLGIFAFFLANKLTSKKFSSVMPICFFTLGNMGLAIVAVASFFKYSGFSDFWYIFISFISITMLMASAGAFRKRGHTKHMSHVILYLGGLSYPIYLLHEAIYDVFKTYKLTSSPLMGCICVVAVTFVEAAILNLLMKKAQIPLKRRLQNLCYRE